MPADNDRFSIQGTFDIYTGVFQAWRNNSVAETTLHSKNKGAVREISHAYFDGTTNAMRPDRKGSSNANRAYSSVQWSIFSVEVLKSVF